MEASDAQQITENIQEQEDLMDDHLVHRDEQEQEPEQGAEGRVPTSQALEEGEERGSLPA